MFIYRNAASGNIARLTGKLYMAMEVEAHETLNYKIQEQKNGLFFEAGSIQVCKIESFFYIPITYINT